MNRWRRGTIAILLVLAAILVAGVGSRIALQSHGTAGHVAQRLRDLLQVPVKVGQVQVGLGHHSTLGQVELYEDGDETDASDAKPWLAAREVETDLGAADLLSEPTKPLALTLRDLSLHLHFDATGRLRTRLPPVRGSLHGSRLLTIENASVTLHQDGRAAPFVVRGITASGEPDAERYRLMGSIDDSYWGSWRFTATLDSSDRRVVLDLTADQANVTHEKLEAIPFIRESVWRQVRLEGTTPVAFRLEFVLDSHYPSSSRYRVALRPSGTRVHIASIGLDADQAEGEVLVEDGRVELRSLIGRTADGRIVCDADLDFRASPTRMEFRLQVSDLDVEKLPPSWTIAFLQGRLTGNADLLLRNYPDRLETAGEGLGQLSGARLGLLRLAPIKLRLVPTPGRYHLTPAK